MGRLGQPDGGRVSDRSLTAASLLFATGALGLLLAPVLPPVAIYLIVAGIGVGYACQQVFAMAMLPDCIAWDTERTGRRQAGVFTGLWTAGETLGLISSCSLTSSLLAGGIRSRRWRSGSCPSPCTSP